MGADAGAYEDPERRLVFGLLVFSNEKDKKRARKAAKRKAPAEIPLNARRQPAFLEYEVRGPGLGARLKFAFYGLAVALLLLATGWLLMQAFL
jgi:hypothetical protein